MLGEVLFESAFELKKPSATTDLRQLPEQSELLDAAIDRFDDAESHLLRARNAFNCSMIIYAVRKSTIPLLLASYWNKIELEKACYIIERAVEVMRRLED